MSLFGKLFRRNKSAEEKFRNELEEDNSVKEVFEDEEEETAEDEMYSEEQGEDGQESK